MNLKKFLKWFFCVSFLIIQCFVILKISFYNIKINVHWLIYIMMFIYFFALGDIKQLFQKLHYELSSRRFLVKAIAIFCFSYVVAIALIYILSDVSSPIYPLWQPLYEPFLWLWIPLYAIIQPAVDNILYHKLFLGTGLNAYKISPVIVFRTFAETGLFLFSATSAVSDNQMVIFALFSVNTIFTISYFVSKNASFSFIVESMYKMAIVITVLIGMPQMLFFSI